MKLVTGLTDEPKQESTIVLDDGSRVVLLLEFRPNQRGWVYDLTWGDFELNGRRLVASPNILRQFRERLTFGLAIVTMANVEPLRQGDLADGTALVYLLNAEDVAAVEATVFPGN